MSNFAIDRITPEDRQYALKHLARHLAAVALESLDRQSVRAHQMEDLHWLLTEREWMETHVANEGSYGPFLEEVQLAWQIAKKAGQQLEQIRSKMISRQVHYALLQTSVNSLASNMLPEMLLAGLRAGRWSGEAALAYAQQMAHHMTKVTMLTQVGSFLHEQGKEEWAYKAFDRALAGIGEIENTFERADAFVALAPHLPSNLLVNALALVAAPEILGAQGRAKVLGALAPHLPLDLIHKAFKAFVITWEIGNADDRAMTLIELAPYLPQSLLSEALEMVRHAYLWSSTQAKVLAALAPYLSPELIPQALEIAETIPNPYYKAISSPYYTIDICYRTAALMVFPQYGQLDERLGMMREALLAVRDARVDIKDRAEGIVLLAPNLPSELLPEALQLAFTLGSGEPFGELYRTRALEALAPHLPSDLQAKLIDMLRKLPFSPLYINILAVLAPHVSQELLPMALTATREIIQKAYASSDPVRSFEASAIPKALVALLPSLPADLMPEALAAVSEIKVGNARSYALAAIAPYLPQELLPKALQIARQIEEPRFIVYHAMTLAVLSQCGAPSAFDEALTLAQKGQYADDSIVILPTLLAAGASMFPPEEHSQFLNEALKVAREIQYAQYRSEAFTEIAKYFPESRQAVLDEARRAADETQEPLDHIKALLQLLPSLPIEQRHQIVSQLPKLVQMTVEKYTPGEESTFVKDKLLSMLGPFLSPEQPKEILTTTQLDLSSDQIQSLVDATQYFGVRDRVEALAQLALRLSSLPSDQCRTILVKALETAEKVDESDYYNLGISLAKLVPLFPPDLYSSALALARKIQSPHALAALVPYVPDEERQGTLDEALTVADIRSTDEKINIPTTLVPYLLPYLPPHQQLEALRTALAELEQIPFPANWEYYRQNLWSIAQAWAQLPQQQAYALWGPALREFAKYRQEHFLAALSGLLPVIVALGGTAALKETLHAVLQICRQWSWLYSSPQRRN